MNFLAPRDGTNLYKWLGIFTRQLEQAFAEIDQQPRFNRVAVSADYTMQDHDGIVAVTSTAAARTITLPKAGGYTRLVIVKDESGGAAANNITVQRSSTDTIDGATTRTINTNYGALRLYSDGNTGWFTA